MNETIRAARMLTFGRWKVIRGLCLAVRTLMKPSHIMAMKRKNGASSGLTLDAQLKFE